MKVKERGSRKHDKESGRTPVERPTTPDAATSDFGTAPLPPEPDLHLVFQPRKPRKKLSRADREHLDRLARQERGR